MYSISFQLQNNQQQFAGCQMRYAFALLPAHILFCQKTLYCSFVIKSGSGEINTAKKAKVKFIILFINLFFCAIVNGQSLSKRALFLGNSYTHVNNLPQMVADAAASTGDTLVFDSNAPGGYTLQGHSSNATSLSKIALGNWDYVALQEQSQLPSFTNSDVANYVFPYARFLDSVINSKNPCAETVLYMTWGRKNGDASNCAAWPPVCTYAGMDSLISLRYRTMAERNKTVVSPVGAVWKYLRQNAPLINLYSSDESHPSVAGTYAAACCFYTVFFRKDPSAITFNAGLLSADAATIRAATKSVVYDSLVKWHIGKYDPSAAFTWSNQGGKQFLFANHSANATGYVWDFGDGTTSTDSSPVHTYSTTGLFTVTLYASQCSSRDSAVQTINITTPADTSQLNSEYYLNVYPNPATSKIYVRAGKKLAGAAYVLYDIAGRAVLKGIVNAENTVLETGKLASSIYFLRVSGILKKTFKLIKE